jgi:hypothetical protein
VAIDRTLNALPDTRRRDFGLVRGEPAA